MLPQVLSLSNAWLRTCRSKRFSPGLTYREPLLDDTEFERFVATVEPLMHAGRDVLWVLAGRTDSNLPKVKNMLLARCKMNIEVFYLCYTTTHMQQYGYWTRQRGIAKFEEHGASFLCLQGQGAQTHA